MASASIQSKCVTCGKGKATYRCEGCRELFCFNHLTDHNRQLSQQLDDIENERNISKEALNQLLQSTSENPLIEQIDQWEQESIRIIQQTAQKARETVVTYENERLQKIDINLNKFTHEIKELRNENDFNETHLNSMRSELEKLQAQLKQSNNIQLKEDSILIKKIHVHLSPSQRILAEKRCSRLSIDTKWSPTGTTIIGGNQNKKTQSQLHNPCRIYIDNDQRMYIVDSDNNRILEWKKSTRECQVVAGGNGQGNRNDQLNCPANVIVDHQNDALIISDWGNQRVVRWPRHGDRKGQTLIADITCWALDMDTDGNIYVSDDKKHEVRKWTVGDNEGILVAGGNESDRDLNQLDRPRYIFVDVEQSIYISDLTNHRVMKWVKGATEGSIVAGGQGEGNDLRQLSNPSGIFIDQFETVYIADSGNNRVVRWLKGSKEGELVVGGHDDGNQSYQFSAPTDLCIDEENNLYVVDRRNHRVQMFSAIEEM